MTVWAECWMNYRESVERVAALGGKLVYMTSNSSICPRPEIKLRAEAWQMLMKISEKLGIFPDGVPTQKAEPTEDIPADERSKNRFFVGKFGI